MQSPLQGHLKSDRSPFLQNIASIAELPWSIWCSKKTQFFFQLTKNGFSQVPIHKDSPNLNVQIVIGPRYTWGPIYGSMTLADEDTNSIVTDNANRATQLWQCLTCGLSETTKGQFWDQNIPKLGILALEFKDVGFKFNNIYSRFVLKFHMHFFET